MIHGSTAKEKISNIAPQIKSVRWFVMRRYYVWLNYEIIFVYAREWGVAANLTVKLKAVLFLI